MVGVAFLVPLTVMVIAYSKIGSTLYKSVREASAMTGAKNR